MGVARELTLACACICTLASAPAVAAEEWRSLETPRYAVLSQLGERDTRAWAAEFDVFIDSFSGLLGERRATLPPLTVVLFAQDAASVPACDVRPGTWGLSGLRRGDDEGAARRAALREGVRWLTHTGERPNPQWLDTGLAEVFASFYVRGGHVRWGEPMPDHLAVLRERGLVPLREFLEDPASVVARDGDSRRYTAQAWALTHLMLLGGDPARQERFGAWLRHGGAKGGDPAFRAAFDADFDGVQKDLEGYVGESRLASGLTPRGMVEHKYVMTAASPIEVASALGRLEVAR
jgi:hypothetical protein